MRQLNATIVLSAIVGLGLLAAGPRSLRGDPPQRVTTADAQSPTSSDSSIPRGTGPRQVTPTESDSIWKSGYQLVEYLANSSPRPRKTPSLKISKIEDGSSANDIRSQAITALPMENLTGKSKERVTKVLDHLSLFRRLPTISLEIEPIMYHFFAQNPDVAVSIWRAMDISTFQMEQQSPIRYRAQSSDGTGGVIDVLYRSSKAQNSECLAICDGWYRPVLPLKPIKAVAILHLESSYTSRADGTPVVTHRVDMFVSFPSQTVASASKIVSPITNPIIDRNFIEISRFMKMMSSAMSLRPGWVEMIGNQMDGVLPARKQQFLDVAARVYVRTRQRNRQQSMQSKTRSPLSRGLTQTGATTKRSAASGRSESQRSTGPARDRIAVQRPTAVD